jgi:nitrous oxidase accessory protein NosD
MSTSPGKTVFKRTTTESTSMIKFTGSECIFEGIRFIDENSTGYCIESTGDRTIVRNCFFENVNGGIKIDGADFCTVEGNHFVDADDHNVEFANTCVGALISNNRFEEASGVSKFNILLSTGTTKSTMVGNVLDWAGGEISSPYRATGMQALATIPLVNVVDSGSNITETT